jgi:hypothetical protein
MGGEENERLKSMVAWASLLGGLGSLASGIGGLFGNKGLSQRKAAYLENHYFEKQNRYIAEELPKMQVKGWLKAGLNPSIMARGGTSQSVVQGPQIGPASYNNHGDAIGSALSGLGEMAGGVQGLGPEAKKRAELENRLLEKRIEVLNRGYKAQRERLPGLRMETRSGPEDAVLGAPNPFERGRATVTNPYKEGKVDPKYADADAYSSRYGEPGEWFFGARNMLMDSVVNAPTKPAYDRYNPDFRDSTFKGRMNQMFLGNKLYDKARGWNY